MPDDLIFRKADTDDLEQIAGIFMPVSEKIVKRFV